MWFLMGRRELDNGSLRVHGSMLFGDTGEHPAEPVFSLDGSAKSPYSAALHPEVAAAHRSTPHSSTLKSVAPPFDQKDSVGRICLEKRGYTRGR